MQRWWRSVLDNRMLSQRWARSLQLTSKHFPWVAPLLVHLSPHLLSQKRWTPGNMLLLRTPKLQQLSGPVMGEMGVRRRSATACIAYVMETK